MVIPISKIELALHHTDIETRQHAEEDVENMHPTPVVQGELTLVYDENRGEKQEEMRDFDLRMETGSARPDENPQVYCLTEAIAPVVNHYLFLSVSGIPQRLWTEGRRKPLVSCGPTLRPANGVSASRCLRTSAVGVRLELRCGCSAVENRTLPSQYSLLRKTSQAKERPLGMRAIRTSSSDLSVYSVWNSALRPFMEDKPIQPVRIDLAVQLSLPAIPLLQKL